MRVINAKAALTDEQADALAGAFLGNDSYDEVISGNCRVVREDGTALAVFIRSGVSKEVCIAAMPALRSAAKPTDNRGMAAGKRSGKAYRNKTLADGRVSKTNRSLFPVESGIVGSFDRYVRIPYCRRTAWTMENPGKMARLVPLAQHVSEAFRREVPGRWQVQKAVCDATVQEWVIPGTVFTTMTVNRNWQTAVHKDAGDLSAGFGCLTAVRSGVFRGCLFVLPKYRLAFDIRTGDVLLVDVHEWHGNSPFIGRRGTYERLSVVLYYREKIAACGNATEELERAKNRKAGDPLYG